MLMLRLRVLRVGICSTSSPQLQTKRWLQNPGARGCAGPRNHVCRRAGRLLTRARCLDTLVPVREGCVCVCECVSACDCVCVSVSPCECVSV